MNLKGLTELVIIQLTSIVHEAATISLEEIELLARNKQIFEHFNNIRCENLLKGISPDLIESMSEKLQNETLLHPYDTKKKLHIYNNGYLALISVVTLMLIGDQI